MDSKNLETLILCIHVRLLLDYQSLAQTNFDGSIIVKDRRDSLVVSASVQRLGVHGF